ncbi:MAG: GspE/PulE family protein [Lachnospiraceae bacterium]
MQKNLKLGEVLIETGYITEEQLNQALEYQRNSLEKKMIGDALIELGFLTEKNKINALSKRLNVQIIPPEQLKSRIEAIAIVPREIAERLNIVPLAVEKDSIIVATDNPLNYYGFGELEASTGKKVISVLSEKQYIEEAIGRNYANQNVFSTIHDAQKEYSTLNVEEEETSESFQQMMDRVDSSPVVKLVNTIVNQAVSMRASDIHIEPRKENVNIRYRIDSDLVEVMILNNNVLIPLITRLKIMSELDIAEKRVPQDGRFSLTIGNKIMNFRISTLPSAFGEKVVIRVLGDNTINIVKISELGMNPENCKLFEKLITHSNGIILVTGPTGSGKTTTLYSALHEVAKPEVNVVTVEDPVEKYLGNVTQVPVNPKAGLTFAAGLRSIMRQDPDIIMVGEVRDQETASIATRAAITGHLVLTSVHTNDAASAFMRMVDMGVEPYMVASAVIGVVSQRLIKVICKHCKEEYTPTKEELLYWEAGCSEPGPNTFYHGKGCKHCNHTGYKGRTAIHEIIVINEEIRHLIMEKASAQRIKEVAVKNGLVDMKENIMNLVREGKTTINQMVKATNFAD